MEVGYFKKQKQTESLKAPELHISRESKLSRKMQEAAPSRQGEAPREEAPSEKDA